MLCMSSGPPEFSLLATAHDCETDLCRHINKYWPKHKETEKYQSRLKETRRGTQSPKMQSQTQKHWHWHWQGYTVYIVSELLLWRRILAHQAGQSSHLLAVDSGKLIYFLITWILWTSNREPRQYWRDPFNFLDITSNIMSIVTASMIHQEKNLWYWYMASITFLFNAFGIFKLSVVSR